MRHLACVSQQTLIEIVEPIITNYVQTLHQHIRGIKVTNLSILERLPSIHQWLCQTNLTEVQLKCVPCSFQTIECQCNVLAHHNSIHNLWREKENKIILPMRRGEWDKCGETFMEAVRYIDSVWINDAYQLGGIHLENKNNTYYYKDWNKPHTPKTRTYSLNV